ncbi:MAG: hypothetical protein J0L92_16955 [Deltaproteobacteria bacterium]|nr:hypothetical protein [Deltaproteobacteria bacterium]
MSKKKFLCVHRSAPGAPRTAPSADEMQAAMARWQAWKAEFDAELLDMGAKLQAGGAVVRDGKVTDGPFVEGKEVLGGFMILETSSLERAIEIVKAMPMQVEGAAIEIREMASF